MDGSWHHVAATFDGTTRKVFKDYVLRSSDTPGGQAASRKDNFCIGKSYGNEFFHGQIKEVRVWRTARDIAGSGGGATGSK